MRAVGTGGGSEARGDLVSPAWRKKERGRERGEDRERANKGSQRNNVWPRSKARNERRSAVSDAPKARPCCAAGPSLHEGGGRERKGRGGWRGENERGGAWSRALHMTDELRQVYAARAAPPSFPFGGRLGAGACVQRGVGWQTAVVVGPCLFFVCCVGDGGRSATDEAPEPIRSGRLASVTLLKLPSHYPLVFAAMGGLSAHNRREGSKNILNNNTQTK